MTRRGDESRAAQPREATPKVLPWLAAATAVALTAPAARANIDQFSTFSVVNQELDDESVIDHFETRPLIQWRDEWERSAQGFRTSEGCLTSGHWFIDTELMLRAPMGKRAWFGANLIQSQSDINQYQYLDLLFNFPMPVGTLGTMYRPDPEKSAQDFAVSWDLGSDTSAYQMNAVFTFEDLFNNFWAWRQAQVGMHGEPYIKHPFEPALHLATRHDHWRADVFGKWLTPSSKQILRFTSGVLLNYHDLWGAMGTGSFEFDIGRLTIGATGSNLQARDQDVPVDPSVTASLGYRRHWSAEGFFRRPLDVWQGMLVQGHYLYVGRCEFSGPPDRQGILVCDDRVMNLDVSTVITRSFTFRVGGLFDRVGVDATRAAPYTYTEGTRNESRAYFGVILRFAAIRVSGVEGIELDPEPYPVYFHHDKAFFQMDVPF